MDIKNKKFLVTGGASFIGSHTVDVLIKKGAKVVIVDNFSSSRKENVNPKAKIYKINIIDAKIESIFKKERPEFVYHFAFNRNFLKSIENPLLDIDSIAGSINILNNARRCRVKKIIFASSGFVYGQTDKLPMKETNPANPLLPYAVAKLAVENYLKFFRTEYNLPYVVLRYATVYGKKQNTGAMADFIKKLAAGKRVKIYGDGKMTRDYVYVDDVVKANILALDIPANHQNPVFNIGTAKETTLNELHSKIARLLKKEIKPIYLTAKPGEQKRYYLSYSKFSKNTDWKPTVDLEKGLKLILKPR